MKIVFMGTPEFAVPILDELNKNFEVILVITQPDSYNYRKKKEVYSPVKEYALKNNLKIVQPENINDIANDILDLDIDLIVTAAYGQFVATKILNHPKYRSINVHGSILPKYRGGAPIQRAIINGEVETGVSIIYMEKEMDAGDILKVERIPITILDNQATIFNKLSILGSKMIVEVVNDLKEGKIETVRQSPDEVTFAPNLNKEDELINFNNSATSIFNQIRGLNPNPGAYFKIDNLNYKVYNSRVSSESHKKKVGIISNISKDSFSITAGDNTVIEILEIQAPGKKVMQVRDFLNGSGRNVIVINKEVNL